MQMDAVVPTVLCSSRTWVALTTHTCVREQNVGNERFKIGDFVGAVDSYSQVSGVLLRAVRRGRNLV